MKTYNKLKVILLHLSILFVLMVSCQNEKEEGGELLMVNNASAKYEEILDSNLVKSVRYIPLQSSKNSLIPEHPQEVIFTQHRIFIYDHFKEGLWIFQSNGQFLNKISPAGEGPGEFAKARSISLDTFNQKIEILADGKKSILTYDFDGNFLAETSAAFYYENKLFLKDGSSYLHVLMSPSMNKLNAEVIHLPKNDSPKGLLIQNKENPLLEFGTTIMKNSLFESQGKVLVYKAFNDTIYQISGSKVQLHKLVKFNENALPENLVSLVHRAKKGPLDLAFTKNHPFIRDYYYENGQYTYLTYMYNRQNYFYLFDHKSNQQLLNCNVINIPQIGLPLPAPNYYLSNGVAFLLSPSLMKLITSTLKGEKKSRISPELLKVFAALKAEDNPVIIMVEFRGD